MMNVEVSRIYWLYYTTEAGMIGRWEEKSEKSELQYWIWKGSFRIIEPTWKNDSIKYGCHIDGLKVFFVENQFI